MSLDIAAPPVTVISDIGLLREVTVPRTSILANAARIEPAVAEQEVFEDLQEAVKHEGRLLLRTPDGQEAFLPESLTRIVAAIVEAINAGSAVLALPVETRLTPAETAQLLGYSRPFVARLLDEGAIPSTYLPGSTHRTIRLPDVLEFQARRERRAEGRRRIMEIAEEYGFPY